MSTISIGLVSALFATVLSTPIAGSSDLRDKSSILSVEDGTPRLVYYGFTKASGIQGTCTGASLGPAQFLTSRHCIENTDSNKNGIVLAGHGAVVVQDVLYVEGADAAIVTIGQKVFQNGCTDLLEHHIPIAASLELVRIDHLLGSVREDLLVVEENDYSVYNADLSAQLFGVVRTSMMRGELTQEGDSGAPVFLEKVDGTTVLAGIVMGLSTNTKSILIEPTSKMVGHFACIGG